MDDYVRSKLRTLLAQPDRDELLDDQHRLAELVRERLGVDHRREAGFLILVLREDVPKRLLAMSGPSVSDTMFNNYARKVSEDTGLKEDIARAAIATWADGLGLTIDAGYAPPSEPPPEPRPAPMAKVAATASAPATVRVAGIALVAQGGIKLLVEAVSIFNLISVLPRLSPSASQLAWIAFIHIVLIAVSVAAAVIGVRAIMNAPGIRIPGIGLCAIGALMYAYFTFSVISTMTARPAIMTGLMPALFTDIAGLVILGGSAVRFALWRPALDTPASGS